MLHAGAGQCTAARLPPLVPPLAPWVRTTVSTESKIRWWGLCVCVNFQNKCSPATPLGQSVPHASNSTRQRQPTLSPMYPGLPDRTELVSRLGTQPHTLSRVLLDLTLSLCLFVSFGFHEQFEVHSMSFYLCRKVLKPETYCSSGGRLVVAAGWAG